MHSATGPTAAIRDPDMGSNSWLLLHDVSGAPSYFHGEENLSYAYDLAAVMDALHASIRAVHNHE